MKNYIEVERIVTSRYSVLREPTSEEIRMIKNDEMFDIEGLINWDEEEVIGEDYSDGAITMIYDGQEKIARASRY